MEMNEARQLAADRQFGKLDDIWTGLVTEKEIAPEEYFAVTDLVFKAGDANRACLLLDILGDHYETGLNYHHAIEVQKHMLRYRKEDEQIRKKLISLYRKEYPHSLHIEDYLEYSGMNKGEPIMKALERLEEYLRYDVGKHFFFERYGMGKVVDTKPAQHEIVIDFEHKKKHFLKLDVARGLLSPVNEEHFLYRKSTKIEELKSMAKDEPERLIIMLLRSIDGPLSASQIKHHLEGIVEKQSLNRFWEKIRRRLEKHDNIHVTGRAAKTYGYVASRSDKTDQAIAEFNQASMRQKYELAQEYAKKLPDTFEAILPQLVKLGQKHASKHPGIALDILMLIQEAGVGIEPDYSFDEVLRAHPAEAVLNDMVNHEHQQRLIRMLQDKDAGKWADTASRLVFETADFRLLDALVESLENTPQILNDVYGRILVVPKQSPKQFQWMLKRIAAGKLKEYMKPAIIPKLIESLEYVRGIRTIINSILSLANFDAVMAQAQAEEASRVLDALNKSVTLSDYEKRNLIRIIEHYFPEFIQEKTDIIYTTEQALIRKKEELERILTVEIPENKKEIGRAREFGDLSENFEYKAAKEKQDQLYEKAKTIESQLQRVQLIDTSRVRTDQVDIGTTVILERMDKVAEIKYSILGRWDTDLDKNIISNEAPLARSMLGKHVGDAVMIKDIEYKITLITSAI